MSFLGLFNQKITPDLLKKGLKNKEFVFYYQPEFDLKTGKVIGVEALMRWVNARRGIIPPNEFIPVLEESGLINQFTEFLLNQTLSDLHTIHAAGYHDLFLAVNLSVLQLKNPNIVDVIKKALQDAHMNPAFLECEITESQNMDAAIMSSDLFKQLSHLNVAISVDDFGTGFSSFHYLRNVDIQKIKIDQTFVADILNNEKDQAIVQCMIQLAHKLKLPILAEGIETTQQKDWLTQNGCDYGQGFWFSRPLPMDQLLDFMQKNISKK